MTNDLEPNQSDQRMRQDFFRVSAVDFKKIPGSPIAYWTSESLRTTFANHARLGNFVDLKSGMSTTENSRFIRLWHEVSRVELKTDSTDAEDAASSNKKWFPYIKGGPFRRWYGNIDYVVNWKNDGDEIKKFVVNNPRDPNTNHWSRRIFNSEFFFSPLLAWSRISMGYLSVRRYGPGMIFSDASNGGFGTSNTLNSASCLLNSKFVSSIMQVLSPTMNFYSGDIERVPAIFPDGISSDRLTEISKADWDSFETSWDYSGRVHSKFDNGLSRLGHFYAHLRNQWRDVVLEMQRLEQKNNRVFIDAYGLQDELHPEVPLNEITLTCNPHYRYGGNKTEAELEALLLADTMREFISYAVGCMFGRYSLDKPGLVLANQGETLADYLRQVPQPTFTPDTDNVIPLLDGEWFNDDITERFRSFLRLTFGETHYAENLKFIEDALGKDIRKFFLKDFYTDHVKRYKKRPIYWLFSSPKGSFNALIYLHRYRPDTTSVVLQYLREFQEKLAGERKRQEQISISASASQADKTRALKSIDSLKKTLTELDDYERDVLHPLATQQIAIDLDDGVKVNYLKLGAALKKISGLEAKEEE